MVSLATEESARVDSGHSWSAENDDGCQDECEGRSKVRSGTNNRLSLEAN